MRLRFLLIFLLFSCSFFNVENLIPFSSNLNFANPIDENDTLLTDDNELSTIPFIVKKDLEFSYDFVFNDFDLIAQLLKNDELDIVGSGEGIVRNDSLNFEI